MEVKEMTEEFVAEMMKLGFLKYEEHQSLWSISKACARSTGLSMGVGAAGGAAFVSGAVSLGGLTIPGYIAGFLAGFTVGTAGCVAVNYGYREKLRELADLE